MRENTLATNYEYNECVIFYLSTKIGTDEDKAIQIIIIIRKCSVDYRSAHCCNKSRCMQLCLYDPSKMSKGHFVSRDGMMSYLEFSLSNKGGGGLTSFSCRICFYWYYFFLENNISH